MSYFCSSVEEYQLSTHGVMSSNPGYNKFFFFPMRKFPMLYTVSMVKIILQKLDNFFNIFQKSAFKNVI